MTKILLVEDHEELWDSLSRRLRRRNFDVMLAHDGQQALDQLAVESPDLILLDMNLPVMDGWTVAQTLRAQGNRVPIIALTASARSSPVATSSTPNRSCSTSCCARSTSSC
jgi:DNA-binding response OmpR family regulator